MSNLHLCITKRENNSYYPEIVWPHSAGGTWSWLEPGPVTPAKCGPGHSLVLLHRRNLWWEIHAMRQVCVSWQTCCQSSDHLWWPLCTWPSGQGTSKKHQRSVSRPCCQAFSSCEKCVFEVQWCQKTWQAPLLLCTIHYWSGPHRIVFTETLNASDVLNVCVPFPNRGSMGVSVPSPLFNWFGPSLHLGHQLGPVDADVFSSVWSWGVIGTCLGQSPSVCMYVCLFMWILQRGNSTWWNLARIIFRALWAFFIFFAHVKLANPCQVTRGGGGNSSWWNSTRIIFRVMLVYHLTSFWLKTFSNLLISSGKPSSFCGKSLL